MIHQNYRGGRGLSTGWAGIFSAAGFGLTGRRRRTYRGPMKLTLDIPDAFYRQLAAQAKVEGLTLGAYCLEVLRDELKEAGGLTGVSGAGQTADHALQR